MNTKDQTKYKFNNGIFGKGRLVLEVVKQYMNNNPKVTYYGLKQLFPDELQANSQFQFSDTQAVIIKVEEIAAKNKKRFYLNEEDIISLDDTKIAVSREWNKGNIQNFINKAGRLGFAIKISVA